VQVSKKDKQAPQEKPQGKPKAPLVVERVSVDELHLDPRNARLHPERNLTAIRASLERFGQQKPIVVKKDGTVVAGNGTLEVARQLGWTHVDVVRTELDGKDAVAFGIADNKTGELAEWDFEVLSGLLAEIGAEHQSSTGFADYEIEPLLQGSWAPPVISEVSPPEHSHAINLTDEQHQRVLKAIEALDLKLGDAKASKAESIALICDAYVAE